MYHLFEREARKAGAMSPFITTEVENRIDKLPNQYLKDLLTASNDNHLALHNYQNSKEYNDWSNPEKDF